MSDIVNDYKNFQVSKEGGLAKTLRLAADFLDQVGENDASIAQWEERLDNGTEEQFIAISYWRPMTLQDRVDGHQKYLKMLENTLAENKARVASGEKLIKEAQAALAALRA